MIFNSKNRGSSRIFIFLVLLASSMIAFYLGQKSPKLSETQLNQSFTSYVTKASASQKLILFELDTVEKIDRTEKYTFLWNLISLPDLVTEMLIPVHYGFYIDLSKKFELSEADGIMHVLAPQIESLAPAANISAITFNVKQEYFFHNSQKTKDELQKSISSYLNAQSIHLMKKYEKESADSLKKFILSWLAKQYSNKNIEIQITFQKNQPSHEL